MGAYIHWFEKKQGKVEQKALDYGLQALLTETMDPDQVIAERMNDWEERKKTLEKQRQDRSTELEQTVQRVVRERAGLEQQMLVNCSEIRRLELNRNAQEKHLEQERREEGKRQAEESRRPRSGQEQENEPTVVEKRVQNVAASSERKSNLTDFSKISKISEIITWVGVCLAILALIDPFSWNRVVCTIVGLVILVGALAGRKYLADWLRTRRSTVMQAAAPKEAEMSERESAGEELQKDWEERLKERKKELRETSHQILRLQERGAHLAVELEEKKIQIENLQEEIREMASPTLEEEDCDMELSGLKLAFTVLTEEETVRHAGREKT